MPVLEQMPRDSCCCGRQVVGLLGLIVAELLGSGAGLAVAASRHYLIVGRVIAIADGDTLTVLDGAKQRHRIRLAEIDAPEKGQPFGTKARENLGSKVFGKAVRVEVVDVDAYHREVGRIYLGERLINREMVQDGFAWDYRAYDKSGEFGGVEADARRHRRGLWADPHPVPPWEWRREKHRASPAR
jgi:endonuclease YncB( thermonuclease family)